MSDEQEFPCEVCGALDSDWDENAGGLRCDEHHEGGREQDDRATDSDVTIYGAGSK